MSMNSFKRLVAIQLVAGLVGLLIFAFPGHALSMVLDDAKRPAGTVEIAVPGAEGVGTGIENAISQYNLLKIKPDANLQWLKEAKKEIDWSGSYKLGTAPGTEKVIPNSMQGKTDPVAGVKGLEVYYNEQNGTPVSFKLKNMFTKQDAAKNLAVQGILPQAVLRKDIALSCLDRYKGAFKINDVFQEFKQQKEIVDESGTSHLRFQQVYKDLPVWGKELIVNLDSNDSVYLIEGNIEPTPFIDVKPGVKAGDALKIVDTDLKGLTGAAEPQLVIHTGSPGSKRLAYHIESYHGSQRWQYFVDAQTGNIVEKYNDTWYMLPGARDALAQEEAINGLPITPGLVFEPFTSSKLINYSAQEPSFEAIKDDGPVLAAAGGAPQSGSGLDLFGRQRSFSVWRFNDKYYLIDTSLPMSTNPPVIPESLGDGNVIVLDALNQDPNTMQSANFVIAQSPNSGWDPVAVGLLYNMLTIYSYYTNTHERNSLDDKGMSILGFVHVGDKYENAFWSGKCMYFGDGGNYFKELSKSLDIVAHEYTHGVVEYTANLEYKFQSGALNEAYADIFACMVDREDWLMGEDVTIAGPGFLRSLVEPGKGLSPLPANMDEYQNLPLEQDNGGVHVNCGIPGRAAYLIAEGLTKEGHGAGIGREKTEKIFYRALKLHLTRQSNFADCRRATVQSAEELYGAGSAEAQAVKTAWDIVGVRDVAGGGGSGDGGGGSVPPVQSGDNLLFVFYEADWFGYYTPYLGVKAADGKYYYVSQYPVKETRPVVVENGEMVLFVDASNNLRLASLDINNTYDQPVTYEGYVRSIAGSRDGRYFAFTATDYYNNYDNKVYLLDMKDQTGGGDKSYGLYCPAYDQGSSALLLFADVIEFDVTGKRLVFDAFNAVNLPGTDQQYGFWNIGILDLKSGIVENLVPALPQGVNIGNPAVASTKDWLLAADLVDDREKTNLSVAINLRNGKIGLIASGPYPANYTYEFGKPSFNGDDTWVAFNRGGEIYKIPLVDQGDFFAGDTNRQEVAAKLDYFLDFPRVYRVGQRDVYPVINVAPDRIDFSKVNLGKVASATLTITNTGNYDLTVEEFQLNDSTQFSHNGAHSRISPGASLEVTVAFRPEKEGVSLAKITIISDDPQTPALEVALTGEGVQASSLAPPDDSQYVLWRGSTKTQGVSSVKGWKVKFNQELGTGSANTANIFVFDKDKGVEHPVKFILSRDTSTGSTTVMITPITPYTAGDNYVLYISRSVKAKNGDSLRNGLRMSFTVAE